MARITDSIRARILELHGKGLARNEITRETGVSAGSVTKVIHDAGLTFDRSAVKSAHEARQVDVAASRTELAASALENARHMHKKAFAAQNGRDAQSYAVAYGIFVDKHLQLIKADAGDGMGADRELLARLDALLRGHDAGGTSR